MVLTRAAALLISVTFSGILLTAHSNSDSSSVPACPLPTKPWPCRAAWGSDNVPCHREAVCPGTWLIDPLVNTSGATWRASDATCRLYIETPAEFEVAFRGSTVTFVGDSVTQHVDEALLGAMFGNREAITYSWHGKGEACDERYNKSVRADVNCNMRGGSGIHWRASFLAYLSELFHGDKKLYVWDMITRDPGDVIFLNTGAWELRFPKAHHTGIVGSIVYLMNVNETIAALAALPSSARLRDVIMWRSMFPIEPRPDYTSDFGEVPELHRLCAEVDSAWARAGYAVLSLASYAAARKAVPSRQNTTVFTMDGIHPLQPTRLLIGREALSIAFKSLLRRRQRHSTQPPLARRVAVEEVGSWASGQTLETNGPQSSKALAGGTSALVIVCALVAGAVGFTIVAVVRYRAQGQAAEERKTRLWSSWLPAFISLLCAGALVLYTDAFTLSTSSITLLFGDVAAVNNDELARHHAGPATVACDSVATAAAWLLPAGACKAASGDILVQCNASSGTPRSPPYCRYAVETDAEFALAFHDSAVVIVGGLTADRLLRETAKLAWACEPPVASTEHDTPHLYSQTDEWDGTSRGKSVTTFLALNAPRRAQCEDVHAWRHGDPREFTAQRASALGSVLLSGVIWPTTADSGGTSATAGANATGNRVAAALVKAVAAALNPSGLSSRSSATAPSRIHIVTVVHDALASDETTVDAAAVVTGRATRALAGIAATHPDIEWYLHLLRASDAHSVPPTSALTHPSPRGNLFVNELRMSHNYVGPRAHSDVAADVASVVINFAWASARSKCGTPAGA